MTQEKMSASPDLAELLRFAISHRLMLTHTALPARVERYDPATQTADVVPVIMQEVVNTNEQLEPAVIQAVPVLWPRAGGWFMSMPLEAGAFGLVLAMESETGAWRRGGGIRARPQTHEKHSWSSAVFLPVNLFPDAQALTDASATNLIIGKDGAGPKIVLKPDGSVEITGGGVPDFVALSGKVATELGALKAAIVGTAIIANDGGASFKSTLLAALAAWPGSVAAAKVRAE